MAFCWGSTRQPSVRDWCPCTAPIEDLWKCVIAVASVPSGLPIWVAAVVIGGWMGADSGSKRLGNDSIRHLLAVVLIAAGLKLVFA